MIPRENKKTQKLSLKYTWKRERPGGQASQAGAKFKETKLCHSHNFPPQFSSRYIVTEWTVIVDLKEGLLE